MTAKRFIIMSIGILIACGLLLRLLLHLSLRASASAPAQFAQEEITRAGQYHKLAAVVKNDQAALTEFLGVWVKICKARNQTLTMDATGDPGCVEDKSTSAPAAPATPPPSPAKKEEK